MWLLIILVGVGGASGAICRFLVTQMSANLSHQIPIGVFICNVLGSLIIGILAAFLLKTTVLSEEVSIHVRGLLITGFLGGFTTFSSFSLDTLNLLQRGEVFTACGYMLASVLLSLIAVASGFYLISVLLK